MKIQIYINDSKPKVAERVLEQVFSAIKDENNMTSLEVCHYCDGNGLPVLSYSWSVDKKKL